jgi:hypothetical protein
MLMFYKALQEQWRSFAPNLKMFRHSQKVCKKCSGIIMRYNPVAQRKIRETDDQCKTAKPLRSFVQFLFEIALEGNEHPTLVTGGDVPRRQSRSRIRAFSEFLTGAGFGSLAATAGRN